MMMKQSWEVAVTGEKLGSYLRGKLGLSLREIKRILEENHLKRNGKVERYASTVLKKGDHLALAAIQKAPSTQVLFEDDYLLLINKPKGVISEAKNFPKYHLVHRLDKDTSGVMILAKDASVKDKMMDLFRNRGVEKEYFVIVDGIVSGESGVIKSRIAKQKNMVFGSAQEGAFAETHWRVLGRGKDSTLILAEPKTGRTHQIRIHFKEKGHPVLGDFHYAREFRCDAYAQRTMLHSRKVSFMHPITNEQVEIKAPLFPDFQRILSYLNLPSFCGSSGLASKQKGSKPGQMRRSTGRRAQRTPAKRSFR